MSAIAWPAGVNNKAYGVTVGYVGNTQSQEYDSGRIVTYAKNTRTIRKFSVKFRWTKAEKKLFDTWFRISLGGGAGTFLFRDLSGGDYNTEYRLSSVPEGSGQRYNEWAMEFTEA